MGLGPMEISGALSRVQDFAALRQQEENRTYVDQSNISGQIHKQVNDRANTVSRANNANNDQKKFDAKEKGSNEYSGDGGQKKNGKKENNGDGVVRSKNSVSSFDIRI